MITTQQSVKNKNQLNKSGFSIVETLIAVTIMGVVMASFSTMIVSVLKEQKALQEKFTILELKNSILSSLADSATCLALLNQGSPTLDLSAVTTVVPAIASLSNTVTSYPELRMGSAAGSPLLARKNESLPGEAPNHMVVQSIQLNKVFNTGILNNYRGDLEIALDPNTMARSFKPVVVKVNFTVSGGLGAAKLVSCGPPNESPPGTLCGSSFDMFGGMTFPSSLSGDGNSYGGLKPPAGTSTYTNPYAQYTSLCQGLDPSVACPPGYTKKTSFPWTANCIKN